MFYQPEIMMYLWLLPVLGMVVLPALWILLCKFVRAMERNYLQDVQGFLDVTGHTPQGEGDQERRRHDRIQVQAPKANISQQGKCCRTNIANVSTHGICLEGVPEKLYVEKNGTLKVVVRTREQSYPMFIRPKWSKLGKKGYVIGAEIIRSPAGWLDFIQEIYQPVIAQPV